MNTRIKNIQRHLGKIWSGPKAPKKVILSIGAPLVIIAFFLSWKETARMGDIAKERAKLPRPAAEKGATISTMTDSTTAIHPARK